MQGESDTQPRAHGALAMPLVTPLHRPGPADRKFSTPSPQPQSEPSKDATVSTQRYILDAALKSPEQDKTNGAETVPRKKPKFLAHTGGSGRSSSSSGHAKYADVFFVAHVPRSISLLEMDNTDPLGAPAGRFGHCGEN